MFKPLTKEQESTLVAGIRARREEVLRRGGRICHCGGLIYPTESGERATCTHHGEPLTRDEIAAIWAGWGLP